MRFLVPGGHGQLGRALARRGAAHGHGVATPSRRELDLCDPSLADRLAGFAPRVVINAAAYTAVDRAETERAQAFATNADGAGALAIACAARGLPLLHVSTDHVFDGRARVPYREDDAVAPVNAYGDSKAAGERQARAAGATIVRTAWLFSAEGTSFVTAVLRRALAQPVLQVVDDQVGCPTWADDLADALIALGERAAAGPLAPIYHVCGDGPTTRHGFATAIVEQARRHGSVACTAIEPITTAADPTRARRPAYAVLDTARIRALGIVPPPWNAGLATVVAALVR
ncbi:MAG: dTDP-4-dehydrorhamnose reductase [Kofleriaceae bacterium]